MISLVPRLSDRTKATKGWGEGKAAANDAHAIHRPRIFRYRLESLGTRLAHDQPKKANESNQTTFLPDEGGVVWGRDYVQTTSVLMINGFQKMLNQLWF